MDNLISVIIPMYNAQSTIEASLKSIITQTYKNFEVVLVDDGSTDNSLKNAKKFERVIPRFKIYEQKNTGPSAARNLGIQKATGDWIFFMDADDTIPKDCFETFINVIGEHPNVDIVVGRAVLSNTDDLRVFSEKKLILDTKDKIASFTTETIVNDDWKNRYPLFYSWGKLIRASLIKENNIKFDTQHKHGEDALFSAHILSKTNKIIAIDKNVYNYQSSNDSLSQSKRNAADSLKASIKFESLVISTFKGWRIYENYPAINNHAIRMLQIGIVDAIRQEGIDYPELKATIKEVFNNRVWQNCLQKSDPNNIIDKICKVILKTKNKNVWLLFIRFCRLTGLLKQTN